MRVYLIELFRPMGKHIGNGFESAGSQILPRCALRVVALVLASAIERRTTAETNQTGAEWTAARSA